MYGTTCTCCVHTPLTYKYVVRLDGTRHLCGPVNSDHDIKGFIERRVDENGVVTFHIPDELIIHDTGSIHKPGTHDEPLDVF